jgi:AcrR family transcriptional regulator
MSSAKELRFEPAIVPTVRPGKEGGARAENRRARTDALCRAGLELFLERGIEPTTVEDITRVAGVAKGSFYRYFPDKVGLVDALFAPVAERMAAAMSRCQEALSHARAADELNAAYGMLAIELTSILLESEGEVRLYLQECRGPAEGARVPIRRLADQIASGAIALTETARHRGLLRDLPAQITAVAVIGAVEGMLVQRFQGRDLGDPGAATAALISMVLEGIRRVS